MSKNTKVVEVVESCVQNLLKSLGFSDFKLSFTEDQNNVIHLQVDISPPEESGLLIGFHGETITALQLIVSQMVQKKIGEWKRIVLNIADYQQKREVALKSLAYNASQKVKQTGKAVTLPFLNSAERRIIHLILADDEQLETYSLGEGRQRRLVIAPKNIAAEQ